MVGFGFAVQDEHHFAAQDDVCCFRAVLVIRVESVRTILPDVSVAKPLPVQARSQLFFVHADWILSEVRGFPRNNVNSLQRNCIAFSNCRKASRDSNAPLASVSGNGRKKGALSSGEKVVSGRETISWVRRTRRPEAEHRPSGENGACPYVEGHPSRCNRKEPQRAWPRAQSAECS